MGPAPPLEGCPQTTQEPPLARYGGRWWPDLQWWLLEDCTFPSLAGHSCQQGWKNTYQTNIHMYESATVYHTPVGREYNCMHRSAGFRHLNLKSIAMNTAIPPLDCSRGFRQYCCTTDRQMYKKHTMGSHFLIWMPRCQMPDAEDLVQTFRRDTSIRSPSKWSSAWTPGFWTTTGSTSPTDFSATSSQPFLRWVQSRYGVFRMALLP